MMKTAVIAATASLAAAVPWNPATDKTMNGQYHFGGPQVAGAPTTHRGTNYFEVTTPAYTSTYAQVNWDSFTVPLDPAVVKELDGKMVNFVGYEFDMVEDKNKDGNFTSVHAWELYNHHYGNTIMGKGTKLVKTGVPVQDHFHDGMSDESLFPGMKFVNTELKDTDRRADAGAFTAGGLIVGNGAESRKTFHYFGEGYGVMVESPYAAAIHPMMIDTKNRALNGTSQRPTGHGMVPPSSTVNPDQMYSPIHECPCTDKWVKKISSYSTLKSGTCNPEITDAPTCFAAAQELGLKPVKMNSTVSNNVLPPGCSIQATSGGYDIVFNTNAKTAGTCGEPVKSGPTGPPLKSTCNLTGTWTDLKSKAVFEFKPSGANAYTVLRMGKPTATVTVGAPTVADPQGTVSGKWGEQTIPAVMNTYSAAGSPVCSEMLWGNGADFVLSPYSNKPPVPKVLPRVAGMSEDLTNITLDMDPSKDLVTITLEGPSDVWFGAGFGYHHVSTGGADPSVGVSMVGTNWTIVVLGNGTITERKLGNHEPGYQLPDTLNVVSNTVVDGRRTVVVTRSIEGKASDVYKFDPTANQVTYINAIGGGPDFEFHQAKASGVVYMVELDYPTCICNFAGDQGSIGGYSWGTQRCVDRPLGQMLDDPMWLTGPDKNVVNGKGVNPTCDIHAYRGGLRCCKGGTIILDSDQEDKVPNNHVWEWHLRYRYYYEIVDTAAPNPPQNTFMTSWWTEHNNGEHDVPVCLKEDKSQCQYTITSNFTAGQMGGCANGCQFITMEGHCHIGCIGMELWIVDDEANPKLLCNATVSYGAGDGWMDEMGYIAGANTCLYGKQDGLPDPVPLHPTTKLRSIKISNNTNAYTGDMGLWEINAAPLAADQQW